MPGDSNVVSFWVCYDFLGRDCHVLPRKELHWRVQVNATSPGSRLRSQGGAVLAVEWDPKARQLWRLKGGTCGFPSRLQYDISYYIIIVWYSAVYCIVLFHFMLYDVLDTRALQRVDTGLSTGIELWPPLNTRAVAQIYLKRGGGT